MADLVTRLILKNDNFDKNLKGAATSVDKFKMKGKAAAVSTSMFSGGLKLAGKTLTKFLGPIGLALTAVDLFSTAINSNRETQEDFQSTIDGAKIAVTDFFTSLKTGDWTLFEDGLINAISKGKEFSRIMRLIQSTLKFGNIRAELIEEKARTYESKIENATNEHQVNDNLTYAVRGLKQGTEDRLKQIEYLEKSVKESLRNRGIKGDYSAKSLMYSLTSVLDKSTTKSQNLDQFLLRRNKLTELEEKLEKWQDHFKILWNNREQRYSYQGKTLSQEDINGMEWQGQTINDIKAEISKWKGSLHHFYESAGNDRTYWDDMYRLSLINDTDDNPALTNLLEGLQGIIDNYGKIAQNENDIISLKNAASSKIKELKEDKKSEKKNPTPKVIKTEEDKKSITKEDIKLPSFDEYDDIQILDADRNNRSIKDLSDEIKFLDEQINTTTDDSERLNLITRKNKIQDVINKKLNPDEPVEVAVEFPDGSINKLRAERDKLVKALNNATTDEERAIILVEINKNQQTENKMLGKTEIAEDTTPYKNTIEGINGMAQAMQTFTSMTNQNAASWLNWASTLLGAIATAIPAIAALTVAKEGEAAANTAAAASGAASSQASIPFVGPILAVAAVASVLAAIMSAPKFANGGIVGGNSTIGDFNIARVNSGEMILNHNQQSRLFNIINGNGSSNSIRSGSVEFKIEGKQLVGVLNNYNHKVSKVR